MIFPSGPFEQGPDKKRKKGSMHRLELEPGAAQWPEWSRAVLPRQEEGFRVIDVVCRTQVCLLTRHSDDRLHDASESRSPLGYKRMMQNTVIVDRMRVKRMKM